MIRLVLVLAFSVLASAQSWPCPEDFTPCVCSYDDNFDLYADCSAAKNDSELAAAFLAQHSFDLYRSLTIDHGSCVDCALDTINQKTFGDAYFLEVIITKTSLRVIEDGTFEKSQNYLAKLTLSENSIEDFPFESLSQYIALQELYLNNNRFPETFAITPISSSSLAILDLSSNSDLYFTVDLVQDCTSLEKIGMSNLSLSEIPEFDEEPIGMFTGLNGISFISFASNYLNHMRQDTIVGSQSTLDHVDFSGNQINLVENQFVRGFTESGDNQLIMSNNLIRNLDSSIWEMIVLDVLGDGSGTSFIDLSDNPIFCSCPVEWLVANQTLMHVFTETSFCEDNETALWDLTIDWFEANC